MTNRVYGYASEKNGNNFLTIDKGDSVLNKYDQVFSGVKQNGVFYPQVYLDDCLYQI